MLSRRHSPLGVLLFGIFVISLGRNEWLVLKILMIKGHLKFNQIHAKKAGMDVPEPLRQS